MSMSCRMPRRRRPRLPPIACGTEVAGWWLSADDLVAASPNYKAEKGLGRLIDAARLLEELPELLVVIVGEGPLRSE